AEPDDAPKQLFGHLASVKAGSLLEGAGHTREVPGVFVGAKSLSEILGSQGPGLGSGLRGLFRAAGFGNGGIRLGIRWSVRRSGGDDPGVVRQTSPRVGPLV